MREKESFDAGKHLQLIKELHARTKMKLEQKAEYNARKANHGRRRLVFQPGDLVWVHLRKQRFPEQRKSKLSPRGDGPFKVLQRIGDNAYKLELPGDYEVSATFNVADLVPYLAVDEDLDSGSNPFQEGEVDEGPSFKPPSPPPSPPILFDDGPITRARAKKLQRDAHSFVCYSLAKGAETFEVKAKTLACVTEHGVDSQALGNADPAF